MFSIVIPPKPGEKRKVKPPAPASWQPFNEYPPLNHIAYVEAVEIAKRATSSWSVCGQAVHAERYRADRPQDARSMLLQSAGGVLIIDGVPGVGDNLPEFNARCPVSCFYHQTRQKLIGFIDYLLHLRRTMPELSRPFLVFILDTSSWTSDHGWPALIRCLTDGGIDQGFSRSCLEQLETGRPTTMSGREWWITMSNYAATRHNVIAQLLNLDELLRHENTRSRSGMVSEVEAHLQELLVSDAEHLEHLAELMTKTLGDAVRRVELCRYRKDTERWEAARTQTVANAWGGQS